MDKSNARMAGVIDAFDWGASPLGPRGSWPPSLRMMVGVALRSQFPMLIFWGAGLIQIYNDAFVPILGARHPWGLGQRAEECWSEIWDTIGPMLHGALEHDTPVWFEDLALTLQRNGYPEQTYFTFSYSQFGEAHEEGGVLCTCVETTKSVQREREFRSMADGIANVIYTHAPDGTVEWSNARWGDYTRLPADIANTPEGWKKVVHPSDYPMLLEQLQRAFATEKPYEVEIRIKPADGEDDSYRWHLLRAVPMQTPEGRLLRWAASATDFHDRRTAQDALREQLERDFDREHAASLAFQNAALPQALPTVPGLRFNAIYDAAEKDATVGGDWYDAFRLPDGRVAVSVGDVLGNGLQAAVTMSAARQAIRGAAHVYPHPQAVLDAADRALRSEQPDCIVTAFLALIDPVTRSIAFATAGHPPPLLRHSDGTIDELVGRGLPLGLRDESREEETDGVCVEEGALLVLYTDGLIESTHDLLQGERHLRAALRGVSPLDSINPAQVLRDVMLLEAVDDVAILTVCFTPTPASITRWRLTADDPRAATIVRREVVDSLLGFGAGESEVAEAEVVLGELLGNVVRHTDGTAEIALDTGGDYAVLHVLDRGPGFTFYARLPNDAMSENGRGLYIMTQLAREVSVTPRQGGGSHARAVLKAKLRRPLQLAAL